MMFLQYLILILHYIPDCTRLVNYLKAKANHGGEARGYHHNAHLSLTFVIMLHAVVMLMLYMTNTLMPSEQPLAS
jgi:hypothetical protein